jgi:thioredoxin 2
VQVVCPACLATNRIEADPPHDSSPCSACGAALFPAEPFALTDAGFDAFLANDGLPLVVEFWSEDCGACRAMAAAFREVARAKRTAARFATLDVEAHPRTAFRAHIRTVPTLVLFRQGAEAARNVSDGNARAIEAWLARQGVH